MNEHRAVIKVLIEDSASGGIVIDREVKIDTALPCPVATIKAIGRELIVQIVEDLEYVRKRPADEPKQMRIVE